MWNTDINELVSLLNNDDDDAAVIVRYRPAPNWQPEFGMLIRYVSRKETFLIMGQSEEPFDGCTGEYYSDSIVSWCIIR